MEKDDKISLVALASVAWVAGSPAAAQVRARLIKTTFDSPSLEGNSVARDAPITAERGWTR